MKFLFILILMSFLITWIIRSTLRYFARSLFRRVNEQARQQQQQRTRSNRREGDVHIENVAHHEKKVDKNMGEYVDYEDIK